jgi:C_GCAxxG_C_C family probable redox protein
LSNHSCLAKELFEKGYNCSQSVFAAFCDETGLDFETALKIASSFGGGMGRLREVCGAVTAMFMIAGLNYGYASPQNDELKAEHYRRIQMLADKFREENGSYICRELLGLDGADNPVPERRTENYYQKRPCSRFVEYAAELMDEFIKKDAVPGGRKD